LTNQQGDATAVKPHAAEECCECGWKFGKIVTKYKQDGAWNVLYIYGAPPCPTWHWVTDCPACGKEHRFYASRRCKQAQFE
jgi:hypothetical protein